MAKHTYQGHRREPGPGRRRHRPPLLDVEAGYLQTGLAELAVKYGTVDNYLRGGLDLLPVTIEKLRIKLFG
ncbi:tyrosine phosphatase family protein [Rhodococcus sp. OK519]|uniref:tyrosine-protein phosphatase n=1 Tax=Rhodococcus sp. OK519 TaxID=2135729 RepID=UPI000D4368C2|nr:tyrosine phosphatase family protein [Rhodococcus sp. OK519]